MSLQPPPYKKHKQCTLDTISECASDTPQTTTTTTTQSPKNAEQDLESKRSDDDDDDDDIYFYTLHVAPHKILVSTDPSVPCNTDFDIEHDDNLKPNLFIVEKAVSTYNATEWLHYHEKQTHDIKRAAQLLLDVDYSLLFICGAGMGVDSKLPDYRSPGGFWNAYKPFVANNKAASNLSLYEMSKTDWFVTDPQSAFGFYAHRSTLYKRATPHSGYHVLYQLVHNKYPCDRGLRLSIDLGVRDFMFMTSNIDGQVIKAGFKEHRIYQTHGSLHHLQCMEICADSVIQPFEHGYAALATDVDTFRVTNMDQIPRCQACGAMCRPNVSFFSDTNDTFDDERIHAQKERFMKWLTPFLHHSPNTNTNNNNNNNETRPQQRPHKQHRTSTRMIQTRQRRKKLAVVEIGCGKSVHSLRWESEYLKSLPNVTLIRINPMENISMSEKTENDNERHITLKLPAKLALDTIAMYMKQQPADKQ